MSYYRGRTEEADRRALDRMEAAFSTVEKHERTKVKDVFENAAASSAKQMTERHTTPPLYFVSVFVERKQLEFVCSEDSPPRYHRF